MLVLWERILLPHAIVTIELHDDLRYRVAYGDLVVYENEHRRVRGRGSPYELRSVEQMRYDFERDVEAVGGHLA